MNTTLPKISLVTVSFNQGQYLEKTILSVIEQNYPNLEYIIIDGGSTDNSVDIIKKYAKHLAFWVSEPDNGQSEAIQKGLDKCTGDIFNWLCSDDYLEPGALFKIAEAFSEKDIDIVYGKVREFNENGTRNEIKWGTRLEETLHKNIVKTFITQPVTFWRISVFREIGINFNMHWFMDYEMWFRFQLKYGISRVKKIDFLLAHYLFHENSKSQKESDYTQTVKSSKFKIDMNTIFFKFCEKIGYNKKLKTIELLSNELVENYVFNSVSLPEKANCKKIINYYLLENAKRYYWMNDFNMAKQLFNSIEIRFLDRADLSEFRNLKFRSNFNKTLSVLRKFTFLQKIKSQGIGI
jgi:glycosyltransferase involved in cell wall biosynthesis